MTSSNKKIIDKVTSAEDENRHDSYENIPPKVYHESLEKVLNELHEDIEQLYRNWFIEPTEDWEVPFVGDRLILMRIRITLILLEAYSKLAQIRVKKHSTENQEKESTLVLMDSWAAITDVLSEFQERIAKEGYLGSASRQHTVKQILTDLKKLKSEFTNKSLDYARPSLETELNHIKKRIMKFFNDTKTDLGKKDKAQVYGNDVASTIRWRRRKGTVNTIEIKTDDLTGWDKKLEIRCPECKKDFKLKLTPRVDEESN